MNQKPAAGKPNNSFSKAQAAATLRSKAGNAVEKRLLAQQAANRRDDCAICLDAFKDDQLARLDCAHRCCSACLNEMFKGATTDESRYPPKCCAPISVETIRPFINEKILQKFLAKKIEWDTPDRTYCSDRDCGRFLHANEISGTKGSCPTCFRVTCTECKNVAHRGRACLEDEATKQALGLMAKEGYKRCTRCQSGVELADGCNHIYCVCGNEFCYVCGERWKSCGCPLYGNRNRNHIDMDGTFHQRGPQVGQRQLPLHLFPQARQFVHQQVGLQAQHNGQDVPNALPSPQQPQVWQHGPFHPGNPMAHIPPFNQPPNYPPQQQILPQPGNIHGHLNMASPPYGGLQGFAPQPQAGYQYFYQGQNIMIPPNLLQNPELARNRRNCDRLWGNCSCGLYHGAPPDPRDPFNGPGRPVMRGGGKPVDSTEDDDTGGPEEFSDVDDDDHGDSIISSSSEEEITT